MAKFKGLEGLSKKMDQMARFVEELDGVITTVSFDPHDPGSIDRAIAKMEAGIDAKAASYGSNDWVGKIVTQTKEHFRARILEKAAQKRLEQND